jgi:hypothetical protein
LGKKAFRDGIPTAMLLHVPQRVGSQQIPACRVREQRADRADLLVGGISNQQMLAVANR